MSSTRAGSSPSSSHSFLDPDAVLICELSDQALHARSVVALEVRDSADRDYPEADYSAHQHVTTDAVSGEKDSFLLER